MKLKEHNQAIELRKKGWMLPRIARFLSVSRSTLNAWFKNVDFTHSENARLLKGREYSRLMAGRKKRKARIDITRQLFEEGFAEGVRRAHDSFFVTGVMLYWAEGGKTQEDFKFSNSDPVMIQLMMTWLRKVCHVPEKKFRLAIHMHSLHSRPKIELYWSRLTKIPRSQFYKTQAKETSLGQRRNILYDGTSTITVSSKSLFRRMVGWKAGILAKFPIHVKV